jgi:hypothetical protein
MPYIFLFVVPVIQIIKNKIKIPFNCQEVFNSISAGTSQAMQNKILISFVNISTSFSFSEIIHFKF